MNDELPDEGDEFLRRVWWKTVRDCLPPDFPEIVTLCGSSRFQDQHIEAMKKLTLEGKIVIPLGLYGHVEGLDMGGPIKVSLDQLHFRKIDISDSIFVVNIGGYIGESTRNEINYAEKTGKIIRYLEQPRGNASGEAPSFLEEPR